MGSTSPFDSHAFPDYPYLDSLSPLPNLPPEQVPFDVTAFKDGEYRTYEVSKPLVGYRYFGSYESPGADDFIAQNYISQSASSTQCSGWGSDAIGRWVSPIRSNDANFVKNALALKQLWGNDAEYVSKLEIPPGTILSVGIAAPQGSLEGGGTQIFIHTIYDADPTLSPEEKERLNDQFFRDNICWVKKCEPISTFNFSD
jgi:hypothetical protein